MDNLTKCYSGWTRKPVIEICAGRLHPDQIKNAIIELDPIDNKLLKGCLSKVTGGKETTEILSAIPKKWGSFLCYNYAVFDFFFS